MKQRRRKRDELEDSLEELDTPPTDDSGRFPHHIPRWEETPAEIVQTRELRALLDGAIAKLPELYRAVFVLRDVEGRSTEETSEILKITVEATKSRLRRARAFLREELNPYMTSARR
jgi:RNA polymerase sigma-70 factor (ECF subfamily)